MNPLSHTPTLEQLQALFEATFNLTPPANIGDVWTEYLQALSPFVHENISPLLCAVLRQTKEWEGVVEKPQLWLIHLALSRLLPTLPVDNLPLLWKQLDYPDPLDRIGMDYGLEILAAQHCISHLLFGLQTCTSHNARLKIVEELEIVGDYSALSPLARLYKRCGTEDWALGRHIARAFRAIHHRVKEEEPMLLLRASDIPTNDLLHALGHPAYDVTDLLQIPEEEPPKDGDDS